MVSREGEGDRGAHFQQRECCQCMSDLGWLHYAITIGSNTSLHDVIQMTSCGCGKQYKPNT